MSVKKKQWSDLSDAERTSMTSSFAGEQLELIGRAVELMTELSKILRRLVDPGHQLARCVENAKWLDAFSVSGQLETVLEMALGSDNRMTVDRVSDKIDAKTGGGK